MTAQRFVPVCAAKPAATAAVEERSALNPCGTFPLAKAGLRALALFAMAGCVAACGSTSVSPSSSDSAGRAQGASGITVFGDIDMGVTRQRSR